MVLVVAVDRNYQGKITPRSRRLALSGEQKEEVSHLVGQSISHERVRRKGLGKGHWAGGSLRPAQMMEKQETP